MSKIIIETDGISLEEALDYVKEVIQGGLVSNGRYGEQYCFATRFTENGIETTIHSSKTKTGTHKFEVYKQKSPA